MKRQTKICGLKTVEAGLSAVQSGAAYLGFIHFDRSPRHLALEDMSGLMRELRGISPEVKYVSVVANPDDTLLKALTDFVSPDLIQLHGHESAGRVAEIAERFGVPLIKAISVEGPDDLALANAYEPHVAHLMFDAKPPKDSTLPGGVGVRFDWTLLEGLTLDKPWFLAGGLNSGNVAEALRITKAPMVDVSSGVETAPGLKDASLIRAFLKAVKGV